VLKVVEPELYVQAKMGTLTWEKVRNALGFSAEIGEQDQHAMSHASEFWQFCTDPGVRGEDHPLNKYAQGMGRYNLTREGVVSFVANGIIDRLTPA
jgi:hypothetical protein